MKRQNVAVLNGWIWNFSFFGDWDLYDDGRSKRRQFGEGIKGLILRHCGKLNSILREFQLKSNVGSGIPREEMRPNQVKKIKH